MVHLITGRAKSGKTTYVRNYLKTSAEKDNTGLMLIVPEQFSFNTEKAMLEICGVKDAQKIEVLSFSRLSEVIFKKYGKKQSESNDKKARLLLMLKAMESVSDSLTLYKSEKGTNARLALSMLSLYDELKTYDAQPSELIKASKDRSLTIKLNEISLILNAYEAVLKSSSISVIPAVKQAAEIAEKERYFAGYKVVIDAFKSFTAVEYDMITAIIKGADELSITLCTDDIYASDDVCNLFYTVNKTAKKLIDISKKNNVAVASDIKLTDNYFTNPALAHIEKNIFLPSCDKYDGNSEEIQTFAFSGIDEECDFVAATVKKLVTLADYRLRDIAVIGTDLNSYKNELESSFDKYDIPYFTDKKVEISSHSLINCVRSVLSFAANRSADALFSYLKTGLTDIPEKDICELENYIFIWNIKPSALSESFSENPFGFESHKSKSEIKQKLDYINDIRKRAVTPLILFSNEIENSSVSQICSILFDFIKKNRIITNLSIYSRSLAESNKALAAEQNRVWQCFCDILDISVKLIPDTKVNAREFLLIFEALISVSDLGVIPEGLDDVIIADAERSRLSNIKIAFIIGASFEKFPLNKTCSGLLTQSDRRKLLESGIELSATDEYSVAEQKFVAYSAVCVPSEQLYMSYSISDYVEMKYSPSELMESISAMTGITTKTLSSLDENYLIRSPRSAFSEYAENAGNPDSRTSTLRAVIETDKSFDSKLLSVDRLHDNKKETIEDRNTAEKLFNIKNQRLSASRVEKYYSCPFKYFCDYGLSVRELKRASIDSALYGTLIHAVMESYFSKYGNKGQNREFIKLYAKNFLDDYLEEKLGGKSSKSNRFMIFYRRMAEAAAQLIYVISKDSGVYDEDGQRFYISDLELPIGKKTKDSLPPYAVTDKYGNIIEICGYIDRVDVLKTTDKRFVRIIDYKTYEKKFDVSKVFHGLDLQMLIYLFALENCGQLTVYSGSTPAGVLYYPLLSGDISADRDSTPEQIEMQLMKKLSPTGLVVDDKLVHTAMNIANNSNLKKHALPETGFDSLNRFIDGKIAEMSERLADGDISVSPAVYDDEDAGCAYCHLASVCGYEGGSTNIVEELSQEEICERLGITNE